MSKISEKIFKGSKHYVTSKFGYRAVINTSAGATNTFHNGEDYGTDGKKIPQYAIENGSIISCGTASDGGKYVWVKYPRINKKMLHYHLDSITVKTGQAVDSNTMLGYTGMTGKATGIHLHLAIIDLTTGKYLDPALYANEYTEEVKQPEATQTSGFYIVKPGDTLSKIASVYKTTWQAIFALNKALIGSNPNIISAGQKLIISGSTTVVKQEVVYTVKKGDTLSSIAKKYNTTYQKIAADNGIKNPNVISIGQKVVIK